MGADVYISPVLSLVSTQTMCSDWAVPDDCGLYPRGFNQCVQTVAVSGFLPGGGEFFLEISSGGGDNLPEGGEKIVL